MTKKSAIDNFNIRNHILHSGIGLATLDHKDRNFITSLSRGLSVLEAFDEANPKLGLADLAKKTGLSKSTVFRLLHTLRTLGFVIPVADENKYTLGPKVLGLGFAVLSSLGLREIAQPYLRWLRPKHAEGGVMYPGFSDRCGSHRMLWSSRCRKTGRVRQD